MGKRKSPKHESKRIATEVGVGTGGDPGKGFLKGKKGKEFLKKKKVSGKF